MKWLAALSSVLYFLGPEKVDAKRVSDPMAVLCVINQLRQEQRLPPLGLSWDLVDAAEEHSRDQASRHFVSHKGTDGSMPQDRLRRRGVDGLKAISESVFSSTTNDFMQYLDWISKDVRLVKDFLQEEVKMFGLGEAQDESGVRYYTFKYADFGVPVSNVPDCPHQIILRKRQEPKKEEAKKDAAKKDAAAYSKKGAKKSDVPTKKPKLDKDTIAPPAEDAKQPYTSFDPELLLCLINKERKTFKLRPLGLNQHLVKAATGHATYISSIKNVTHFSVDGKTKVGGRIKKAGFKHKGRTIVNENIAYGYADNLLLIKALTSNSIAKKYMFSPNATWFGAGRGTSSGKLPYYDIIYITDKSTPTNIPDDKKCDIKIANATVAAATAILKPGTDPKEALKISGPTNLTEVQSPVDVKLLVCLINKERTSRKLKPLGLDDNLGKGAQMQANHIAKLRKLTNAGDKGNHVGDRLDKIGYKWTTCAENIAYGYINEYRAGLAWMRTPDQLKSLVHPEFTALGAAKALTNEKSPFYVVVLGADGKKPKPAPTPKECDEILVKAALADKKSESANSCPDSVKRMDDDGYGFLWKYNKTASSTFSIAGKIPPPLMDSLLKLVNGGGKEKGQGEGASLPKK